jgi:Flp pilus assembly protein TadG
MKFRNSTANQQRSQSGQAIAEGAAAVVMIMAVVIGGLLFLVNSGVAAYYKQKLAFASEQAAAYAASLPESSRQDQTKSFVPQLLKQLGLNASSVAQDVFSVDIGGQQGVLVSISAKGLPSIGGTFGPIDMTDTGVMLCPGSSSTTNNNNLQAPAYVAVPDFWHQGEETKNIPRYGANSPFDAPHETDLLYIPVASQGTTGDKLPPNTFHFYQFGSRIRPILAPPNPLHPESGSDVSSTVPALPSGPVLGAM